MPFVGSTEGVLPGCPRSLSITFCSGNAMCLSARALFWTEQLQEPCCASVELGHRLINKRRPDIVEQELALGEQTEREKPTVDRDYLSRIRCADSCALSVIRRHKRGNRLTVLRKVPIRIQ